MARLTTAQRKALPKSDFAVPSKAPGSGSFPIPDRQHVGVARSYAARKSPAVQAAVERKIAQRYPGMMRRSTKGSPPFTAAELAQGHRKVPITLTD